MTTNTGSAGPAGSKRMRGRWQAFLPVFLFAPAAWAARPMVVDDARIVDPKACQIETWVKQVPGDDEFWALPACNPLGPFELTLGLARVSDHNLGAGRRATNAAAQIKAVVDPLETNGFGWGFVVGDLSRPGIDQQRNLVGEVYGYGMASWSAWDDRFLTHANLGWVERKIERERVLTFGAGFEWQTFRALPNLQLLAEAYGDAGGTSFFQAGVRLWLIPNRWQIDATYGNSLDAFSRANRWITLGIRLLTPPLLP